MAGINYKYVLTDVNDDLPNTTRAVVMVHDAPARWVANVGFLANGKDWLHTNGRQPVFPIRYWMDVQEPPVKPNKNGRSLYDCKFTGEG